MVETLFRIDDQNHRLDWYELDEAGIVDLTIRHVKLWFVGTHTLHFDSYIDAIMMNFFPERLEKQQL